MSKWYISYSINGIKKWNIYEAKHTVEAKDLCIKENNLNNIEFIEVDVYTPEILSDEIIEDYKMRVISLV